MTPTHALTETETVVKRILPYLRRRGYIPETDLDFETPVSHPDRYEKGYVDILVTCGKPKPLFLIEAKRSSKKLTTKDRDQAIAYGSAVKVLFVIVTNGTDIRSYNVANGQPIKWDGALTPKIPTPEQLKKVTAALKADKSLTDVPLANDASLPFRPGLPLKQLNALFARCHNAIRKIEKDEEHAFSDFSKLLFLKLLEEKADTMSFSLPYSYRFHELAARPDDEADQVQDAIEKMISAIRKKTAYGDVLDEPIYLKKPRTFRYIVQALAGVCFNDSGLDTKGAAFEYFVRATLKGKKLGQYFTPRPLVELMTTLVGKDVVTQSVVSGQSVKVLDPACGTGGFLVYMMKESLASLERRLESKTITKKTHDSLAEKIRRETFFGSDANEGVACAAKMNMIIAGDGHTNVQAEDSLPEAATNWHPSAPDCDLILTNPPFGTSEAESLTAKDLDQYTIKTTRGQYLFLQKMVLCTLPGGHICTVIDEGVLNTDSGKDLRRFVLETTRVRAVLSLPSETFQPNKINVKASVLLLERRTADDPDLLEKYDVAFCALHSLGYDGAGEKLRGFQFDRLLAEVASQAVMPTPKAGTRAGYQWKAFDVPVASIQGDPTFRLDLKYWEPSLQARISQALACGAKTIRDLNTVPTSRGSSPLSDLYVDAADGFALVVKAGCITPLGELRVEGADYVEKAVYDECPKTSILMRGDVLLASTGDGTLGKSCVYDRDLPAVADGHVTIIRPDLTQIDPHWLSAYLRCGFGFDQVMRLYSGSTGLIELTPEHVDRVVVASPGDVGVQAVAAGILREREVEYHGSVAKAEEALRRARVDFGATGAVDATAEQGPGQ